MLKNLNKSLLIIILPNGEGIMKRTYVSPSFRSESIEIGVFGCYGSGNGGYNGGGFNGGHKHHGGFGFDWFPFAAFMFRRKKR